MPARGMWEKTDIFFNEAENPFFGPDMDYVLSQVGRKLDVDLSIFVQLISIFRRLHGGMP